jgi:hypothetical protein
VSRDEKNEAGPRISLVVLPRDKTRATRNYQIESDESSDCVWSRNMCDSPLESGHSSMINFAVI